MSDLREKLRKRSLENFQKPEHTNSKIVEQGDRPCPICGKKMQIQARENVIIDVCQEHGIWLDSGELDQILLFTKAKDLKNQQRLIRRAKKEGYIEARCEPFSFFFDRKM